MDTELTRAARNSVSNADKITTAEDFGEEDFVSKKSEIEEVKKKQTIKKKTRKAERQRKLKGRKRK